MIELAVSTTGTAGTEAQFANLELIDASGNTDGVTFNAATDMAIALTGIITVTADNLTE